MRMGTCLYYTYFYYQRTEHFGTYSKWPHASLEIGERSHLGAFYFPAARDKRKSDQKVYIVLVPWLLSVIGSSKVHL